MKKRIISAVIALAIIIPLIILGGTWFYSGVGIIGIIGFYEIMDAREKKRKFPILVKILSMISFALIMLSSVNESSVFIIEYRYLAIPFLVCLLPLIFYNKSKKYDFEDAAYLIGSIFFLGIAFNLLICIRNIDVNYFLYLIIITIMTDTFAHFVGTKIGKYKLAPSVSPNKTIEGFIGGVAFGTFIGTVFYTTMFNDVSSVLLVILITLVISICSSLGDLVFSAIKRHFDIKDFGKIMPGHGGVLDRLDSVLIAGLTLAILITLL